MNKSDKKSAGLNWILLTIVLVLAVAAGLGLRQLTQAPAVSLEDIDATVLEPPSPINPFELVDHTGNPFTQNNFEGKWTFLFFGFTNCPDICPTTMNTLTQMEKLLDENDEKPTTQVVFVSVDPERDTVARLAEYVPYFHPDHIGVTGTTAQVRALTDQLGILHVRADTESDGNYQVNHSSAILVVNPEGQLRALFSGLPHRPDHLASSFMKIAQLSAQG